MHCDTVTKYWHDIVHKREKIQVQVNFTKETKDLGLGKFQINDIVSWDSFMRSDFTDRNKNAFTLESNHHSR